MRRIDRDAFERAIEICRTQKEPADRIQIEHMLASRLWREVAEFASYSCQCDALHLLPWQNPPCWANLVRDIQGGPDGISGDYAAAVLLRKMLDAGLSRFEPDPLVALKQAKKRPPPPPA